MSPRVASRLKRSAIGDRLVRRNPLFYGRASRLFAELEALPLESRRRVVEERTRAVLAAAQTRTAYGRATAAGPSLEDWPLLEKDAVRDDPDAFVGSRRFAAHAGTSGTTGTPLSLLRSPESVAVEQAAIDRLARAGGVDLRAARVAVLRGDDVAPPAGSGLHWRDDVRGRRRVFQSNDLSPATLGELIDGIEAFAPACLLAYPTVLESLCRLLDQVGRRLEIPLTLTSSEVLPAPVRGLAERILSTSVIDYYGQAERVSFAYGLRESAYTFLPGYGRTELIRVDGADEDSDLYEIVGTSLWNLAMPLIRYRTADFVRLPRAATPELLDRICLGVEAVEAIAGRADDFLLAPDGSRLVGIDHVPRDVDNVLRVQLIQEKRDAVRVLVLAKAGFGGREREQLAANLRRKLPPTMTYTIEVSESLEQRGRKTPLVIRRPEL